MSHLIRGLSALAFATCVSACSQQTEGPELSDSSLSALVVAVNGVYFYPPLAPEPVFQGTFDNTIGWELSVILESAGATGVYEQVVYFNGATPWGTLYSFPDRGRYLVNVAAARYFTDPSRTYRFRIMRGSGQLATATMPARIFDVLASNPALMVGVQFRVETTAAPCFAAAEVCDGVDNDCDGTIDEDVVIGTACDTGLPGVCGAGVSSCVAGAPVCTATALPSTEVCDGLDNDCNGLTDDGIELHTACDTGLPGVCSAGTAVCEGGAVVCAQSTAAQPEVCDGLDNDCNGLDDDLACGPTLHGLAATNNHTCAIGAGGTVKCWGQNGGFGRPLDVAGISGATSIAGGGFELCAVVTGGEVKCWDAPTLSATTVAGVSNAVKVTLGYSQQRCALLADGTVTCWGYNTAFVMMPPHDMGLTGVVDLATGGGHSCALLASGGVRCWGSNNFGSIGNGLTMTAYGPTAVTGISDAIAVYANAFGGASCAIHADHTVSCWGENPYGELGFGVAAQAQLVPVRVPGLADVASLAGGEHHTCARFLDGHVSCWGRNQNGELGLGYTSTEPVLAQTPVTGLSGVVDLIGGILHTCAGFADGSVKCFGRNDSNQLGDRTAENRSSPVDVYGMPCVRDAAGQCIAGCSQLVSCTSLGATSGEVSDGCQGVLYCGPASEPQIAVGESFACGVRDDATVRCWGRNNQGQLGNSAPGGQRTTAVAVTGLSNVRGVAAGQQHACAVSGTGTVSCWGWNRSNQLGNGSTTSAATPVSVTGLTTAVSVGAGRELSCARLRDNTVTCWGLGWSATPTPVSVSDIVQLSLGGDYACGVRSNGTVICWGAAPGIAPNLYPTVIAGISTARSVSASADGTHTCATLSDRSVVCWGTNANGQLGDGTTTTRQTVGAVPGLSDVRDTTGGTAHSCSIGSGGAVSCWGSNATGQLGLGNTTQFTTPQSVSLAPASSLAAAWGQTCAKLTDGTARCWGLNAFGQLGDNSTTQRTSPVAVVSF